MLEETLDQSTLEAARRRRQERVGRFSLRHTDTSIRRGCEGVRSAMASACIYFREPAKIADVIKAVVIE